MSVCVITHAGRIDSFPAFLDGLAPALMAYPGKVELVIGNNGGSATQRRLADIVERRFEGTGVDTRVAESERNDIAVGRNLAIDSAQHELVAFIDDDELPGDRWLSALIDAARTSGAAAVAGPVESRFPAGTPRWIRHMDLHNARGRQHLDDMPFAPAGNFLIDRALAGRIRFNQTFGQRGGSDTDFFLRVVADGERIVWASDAIVHETVTERQASVRATLKRCLLQGSNYRRILEANDKIGSPHLFTIRAVLVASGSFVMGGALLLIGHRRAGDWIKRAVSNLGKVWRQDRALYG